MRLSTSRMIASTDSGDACFAMIRVRARWKLGRFIGSNLVGIYRPWIQQQRNRYDGCCQWMKSPKPPHLRLGKNLGVQELREAGLKNNSLRRANSTGATWDRLSAERKISRSKACCGSRVRFAASRLTFSRTPGTRADWPVVAGGFIRGIISQGVGHLLSHG